MLEHAVFTVASPEAAAAILWRDSGKAPDAAEHMRITAQDLKAFGLIDEIIPEPAGGAHRDHMAAAQSVTGAVTRVVEELRQLSPDRLVEERYEKYRDIAFYLE
jgi:acetyl-CoA carboxylase carboxyl transferase subunit alpha